MAYDEFTAKMVRECERLEQENAQLKADCDTWTKKYVELDQAHDILKAELSRAVNLLDEVANYTGDYNSALEDDWVMSRIHQVLAEEDKA